MKRLYKTFLFLWIFLAINLCSQVLDHPLNVMTFNIRYDNPDDGPNAWPHRKELVASTIEFHKADVVGMQEALAHQLDELSELLPHFSWIGVARDDGKTAGEFSPIFFRADRMSLLENGTFWLSETPDNVSRGWDAACHRVVTWGQFRDKMSGQDVYVFNTHFDHLGQIARKQSALLVRKKVVEISRGNPFILTGDFNAEPGSDPIRLLLESAIIQDSRLKAEQSHHGPTYTFTGFNPNPQAEGDPIDYIFISPHFQVIRHATISDHFNGRLPSDHYPVFAEIK
ncbi:endonuclease/exonuclease/phosphatase family protein [candidate division KSB1 bacterium]|nr:endonuclease/exonuclease/phosphatase family protein [candidate division KSB1 bacterium]